MLRHPLLHRLHTVILLAENMHQPDRDHPASRQALPVPVRHDDGIQYGLYARLLQKSK